MCQTKDDTEIDTVVLVLCMPSGFIDSIRTEIELHCIGFAILCMVGCLIFLPSKWGMTRMTIPYMLSHVDLKNFVTNSTFYLCSESTTASTLVA